MSSAAEGAAQAENGSTRGWRLFGRGDVRPGRRHLVHERVDLSGGHGSPYDGERRPVGDRLGSAGLCCLHPHQLEDGRPDGPQARLRDRPARLRDRRPGDDADPEPDHCRHLLGDHRWPRSVPACCRPCSPSSTATSPEPPRRRPTPWSAPPRRSPLPSARFSAGSSPPICRGASGSDSRSSSSWWCCPRSDSSRTCPTRDPERSTSWARFSRSSVWVAWSSGSWSGRREAATSASSSASAQSPWPPSPTGSYSAIAPGSPPCWTPTCSST